MTVRIVSGDIFASGADVLVNPVNCIGTMGAGLAREFRRRFPVASAAYMERCRVTPRMRPGGCFVGREHVGGKEITIIHVATKDHWRDPSEIMWIHPCVRNIARAFASTPYVTSLAVPALGCGCGGLSWDAVRPIMTDELGGIHDRCDVMIYGPQDGAR